MLPIAIAALVLPATAEAYSYGTVGSDPCHEDIAAAGARGEGFGSLAEEGRHDPHDLAGFGAMLVELCEDRPRARQMGMMAKESVRNGFLGPRHLTQYFELFRRLAGA